MFELPLFPLETVLFPSMPIHLHIFEPRYREMINRCITLDQPFGVVLIRRGAGGRVGNWPSRTRWAWRRASRALSAWRTAA